MPNALVFLLFLAPTAVFLYEAAFRLFAWLKRHLMIRAAVYFVVTLFLVLYAALEAAILFQLLGR